MGMGLGNGVTCLFEYINCYLGYMAGIMAQVINNS